MATLDLLNLAADIASILGLVVSIYTLYKVVSLPAALRRHSRDKQLTDLIDQIVRLPGTKPLVEDPTAKKVELIIQTIQLYYISRLPFRHRTLKALLSILEREIQG